MSETTAEQTEQAQEVNEQAQTEQAEVDWKAEARKWEARAKANKDAAEELESIKAERMSDLEKAQARAEKAEAELETLRAERKRMDDVRDVAKATGAPVELLEYCTDRAAMEAFADEWAKQREEEQAARQHVPAAPKARTSREVHDGAAAARNRDVFASMMTNKLSR